MLDIGNPEVGALYVYGGIYAVVGMHCSETLGIFDGIFHAHGVHPALDLLSVNRGSLVLRIHSHNLAAHLILFRRFLRRLGSRLSARYQDDSGKKQRGDWASHSSV